MRSRRATPPMGSEQPQRVSDLAEYGWPTSVSRNGIVTLMLTMGRSRIAGAAEKRNSATVQTVHPNVQANEQQPAISPDGRWLAYVSDESGRNEVYVEPFPSPGAKIQVSSGSGMRPRWSADGRQLFYNSENQFYMVSVTESPTLGVGKPVLMFEKEIDYGGAIGAFDVTPDGQHFLVTRELHPQPKEIVVTVNWLTRTKQSASGK